ncbi:S1 family peptidase [soil metagenome]
MVMVQDRDAAETVQDAGLEARVGRGQDDLEAIADRAAGVAADSPSLRSIAPDLKRQQVVVTLAPDAPASLEESLRSITGVTVESGPALSTTADVVPGRIMDLDPGTNCSLGFPGTTSDGNNVLLTAGHCIEGLPDILDENGTKIGRGVDSRFVSGQVGEDIGLMDIDAEDQGQSFIDRRGAVGDVPIRGLSENPIGSEVCKAGNTTGWTCGTINAYDVTVNYVGGTTITGLVDSTVCVEGGDSGGAYIGAGNLAQGMTSGGPVNSDCGPFNSGGSSQGRSYYAPWWTQPTGMASRCSRSRSALLT